jgi:hypothetical protein
MIDLKKVKKNKMITQHAKFEIHTIIDGCTFTGTLNGYQLIFTQYDSEPIELNLDSLRDAIGVKEPTDEMISNLIRIAAPAIEQAKYFEKLMCVFSDN